MTEEMLNDLVNKKFTISNEYSYGIIVVIKALIANLIAVNGLDRKVFVEMLTEVSEELAAESENMLGNQAKRVAIDDILRYMKSFETIIEEDKQRLEVEDAE